MSVTIAGTLKDGMGFPLANTGMEVRATKTSSAVVTGAVAYFTTTPAGAYSFNMNPGAFAVFINFGSLGPQHVGNINIYTDSINGTLEDFLTIPGVEEVTPEILAQVIQARLEAQIARDQAIEARNQAVEAAQLAQAGISDVYPTQAAAQAAVDAGTETREYFYVRTDSPAMLAEEYQRSGTTITPLGRGVVSSVVVEQIKALTFTTTDEPTILWNFVNVDGYSVWRIMDDGTFGTKLTLVAPDGVRTRDLDVRYDPHLQGVAFVDADGRGVKIVDEDGVVAPNAVQQAPNARFTTTDAAWLALETDEGKSKTIIDKWGNLVMPQWVQDLRNGTGGSDKITSMNARNMAYSSRIKGTFDTKVKRLTKVLNHIIWYGQSLSTNQEGWPALSKTPYSNVDAYMIGESSRPNGRTNADFIPIGGEVLNPLKAVVQHWTGSPVLTDAEVAALAPGEPNEGEGGVAAVNMFKQLYLKYAMLDRDEDRKLVLTNTGVNGRTIEQLSKGASPELYNRPRQAARIARERAAALGVPYAVLAIAWLQGEWNSQGQNGGTQDRQAYYNLMLTLFGNMRQDFAYGQGQLDMPAVFMYQTGAQYTVDTTNLSIGMAQLDFCRIGAGNHAYMATPSYPFPDKGGHLTSNGYRWMDMQFAKVMFKVLVLGEGWEPLSPIEFDVSGREILVGYHVPEPPLQFRASYNGLSAYNGATKGFRVFDAAGQVTITSVEIAADTVVKITAARELVLPVEIFYAAKSVDNGNGNVFDSDATVATENYVYQAGTGQYAGENIAALVDKPYPLNNASAAFYTKIES